MKLESHVCPHCGASLDVTPGKLIIVCEYCTSSFSLEKPKPEPKLEPKPEPKPRIIIQPARNSDYKNQYNDATRAIQKAQKVGKGAGIAGLVFTVIIIMVVSGISFFASKSIKNRVGNTQNRIRNNIKNRKIKREKKAWRKFRSNYGTKISSTGRKALNEFMKKYKFPIKGDPKATHTIYNFYRYSSYANDTAWLAAKRVVSKFKGKIKWVYIPLPQDELEKSQELVVFFELFEKAKPRVFWRTHKLMNKHRSYMGSKWKRTKLKHLNKFLVRAGYDKNLLKSLIKSKFYSERIKAIEKLAETLEILQDKPTALVGDYFYDKSYFYSGKIEEVIEKTWKLLPNQE
jgi:hypothetical protein